MGTCKDCQCPEGKSAPSTLPRPDPSWQEAPEGRLWSKWTELAGGACLVQVEEAPGLVCSAGHAGSGGAVRSSADPPRASPSHPARKAWGLRGRPVVLTWSEGGPPPAPSLPLAGSAQLWVGQEPCTHM